MSYELIFMLITLWEFKVLKVLINHRKNNSPKLKIIKEVSNSNRKKLILDQQLVLEAKLNNNNSNNNHSKVFSNNHRLNSSQSPKVW